jgi:hypothetical protein
VREANRNSVIARHASVVRSRLSACASMSCSRVMSIPWTRLGLCVGLLVLGPSACSSALPTPRNELEASRIVEAAGPKAGAREVTTAPAGQPRVIIQAPPSAPVAAAPREGSPEAAPGASPPAQAFTPSDSPLLATFDSKPHGKKPVTPREFQPKRKLGWQLPPARYYGYGSPYYGHGYPYYGGGWGYPRPLGYGYPRGFGMGMGMGFGLGFGLARPYYW